ncbi:zinc finger protein 62 homolog [Maniola jurtina]|uniref:zinc finger protein 62 homolog n=1 Tax=Maniola jurtina TaxID=191418 RepID=UPI001E68B74E|nr:zinc finger protein 62 homolog [Maniola jurtina]
MSSILLLKSMLIASVLQKTQKQKKKIKAKKSPVVKAIYSKMCRVCNKEVGTIPIFKNSSHPNIAKEIENFAGVTINKKDKLPKHICQKCLDLLNGCITFREMCQRTNKQMIELSIKKETEITSNYEADTVALPESDESYNVPSPAFSEDNSEIWGCTVCNKHFSNLDSYNTHLSECMENTQNCNKRKRPKEKSKNEFLCDICGKVTRSNANLIVHMSIHENIFPFKCEQCPYMGRTMDLLKVHKRSHLTDKPFKCTQCPKSTSSSSNLAKHMRHVHSTARDFKCSYCDKAFIFRYDMKKHVRDIHLRQGTVECDLCFKKFNTKKILQGHRVKVHKIKGDRHGRLPSYLQCQLEQNQNGNSQWERLNNCEPL